jgi:hypothetical protein
MKNVSKLALFVAAGMLSAGANANTIVTGPEGANISLGGEFSASYVALDALDTSSTAKTNENDLGASFDLDLTAERSFGAFDAYAEVAFTFDTLDDGSSLEGDGAVAGLSGAFGQIEVGDSGGLYDDVAGSLDFFEEETVEEGDVGPHEVSMVTYSLPETNGLSVNLQAAIEDEADGESDKTRASEEAFQASAGYDFGLGSILVAYSDHGLNADSNDEASGITATFNVSPIAEVTLKHAMQTSSGADTDFTGIGASINYGAGSFYGAYQSVSPDSGDDRSQYAIGVNSEIEDGFTVYAELGNFDAQSSDDLDESVGVGLIVGF